VEGCGEQGVPGQESRRVSYVLGIDVDVRAAHFVLLADDGSATYTPAVIADKRGSFEACRNVRDAIREAKIPWDDIWLCGIERPFSQSRGTARIQGMITGAILSAIPRGIPVLDMPPNDRLFGWKALSVGKTNATKGEVAAWALNIDDRGRCSGCGNALDRIRLCCDAGTEAVQRLDWPQDAYDALAIAHAARRLNEQAVDAA
jgi:hypothetical protein